jgi:hypothetical protein
MGVYIVFLVTGVIIGIGLQAWLHEKYKDWGL